jgi:methylated-DNA-[protein]-cysteine S-methyltransferase
MEPRRASLDGSEAWARQSVAGMSGSRYPEISLWLRREGPSWFGLAEIGGALVATSVARTRREASRSLARSLPSGAPARSAEGKSAFADETAMMLAAIEAGDESGKRFELAFDCLGEPAAAVFRLVAAVPIGYATSYGRVAEAAGTIAREVGRLMAWNPLYPIVPCHRVVGADYSLVGYRGATSGPDLEDKLARLRAEARGWPAELSLGSAKGLSVFPVERVIEKAEGAKPEADSQLSLW